MRKKIVLFTLFSLFAGLFFLRHAAIAALFELAVQGIEYESRSWEEGSLVYKNLKIGRDFAAEEAEVDFELEPFPFYIQPHIYLRSPRVIVEIKEKANPFLSALIPQRYWGAKLDVEDGFLELKKEEPSFFTWAFQSGEEKDEIGRLFVYDANGEVGSCNFEKIETGLSIECDIPEREIDIEELQGKVELHLKVLCKEDLSFSEADAVVDLESFSFTYPKMGIYSRAKHLQAHFHCPELSWQKIVGQATLEGGEIQLWEPNLGISNASGSLTLDLESEPRLEMQGMVVYGEKSLPLMLSAKGRAGEDASFWIEGEGTLSESGLLFSVCRPALSSYILQTEFSNWGSETLALLPRILPEIEAPSGLISGKLTAWLEGKELTRLLWEKVEGKDLYFEWASKNIQAFAAHLTSSGEWKESDIKSLDLTVQNGMARKDAWHMEGVEGEIHLVDGLFQESLAHGVFQDMPLSFTWAGPLSEIFGSVRREGDALEFGLSSLQNGWFHGNIALSKYLPFLEGDVQVAGNFSTEQIEGSFRTESLRLNHPSFEGEVLPTKEALFSYDFFEGWRVSLPLQGARLKEKEHNVLIEDIEGSLVLSPEEGHMEQFSASCGGVLWQGKLDFSKETLTLTHLQGEAAGYHISCDAFRWDNNEANFDLCIQKDKEEVAKAGHFMARLKDDAFEFQGKGVFWEGAPLNPVQGFGKKLKESWQIEKVQLGDLFAKGSISNRKGKGEIRWKEYKIQGEGALEKEGLALQIASLEGFRYRAAGRALIPLNSFFSHPKIQNLSLSFEDSVSLQTDSLAYHESTKKWQAEEVHVKGTDFKGVMAVKMAPSFLSFQGVIEQGSIASFRFKQLMGLYEAPFLNMKFHTVYQDEPFQMTLRVNTDRDYAGDLFIQEPQHEEGFSVVLGPSWSYEKIDGCLRGIEAHLKKEASFFTGSIQVHDGQKASLFLDSLKLIKGVELSGKWKKEEEGFSFLGEMKGKDVEISSKRLQELRALVEIHPEAVSVKNLSIFDDKLSLFAKQIECKKSLGSWMIDIPLIKGQNIRPSQEKPFLIRHLFLSDLRGILGDTSTFRGRGSFNFTNAFKRGETFFEIPGEMLKNLGLDLDLLTPISGEVEYQLKGNKIYLTSLKNTFSEGRRSQFYLPEDATPSTIDLDGNLDLKLRLKQDVVLKWAEPFIISIGGTFESPKYELGLPTSLPPLPRGDKKDIMRSLH